MSGAHAAAWVAARPYMRARKNDIHIPLAYRYAERLLEHHPEADREVVLLAILLHDIGWALVAEERILAEGFDGDMRSAIRIAHEREGASAAGEILRGLRHEDALIDEVVEIIGGHDSRLHALSRNDELVKDADKLWRFSVAGASVAADWWGMTPAQYTRHVEPQLANDLFTDAARAIAADELAATRELLQVELLA